MTLTDAEIQNLADRAYRLWQVTCNALAPVGAHPEMDKLRADARAWLDANAPGSIAPMPAIDAPPGPDIAKLAVAHLEALDGKRELGRVGTEALKPTYPETALREALRMPFRATGPYEQPRAYKGIPISAARELARKYRKDQVIVVAWDEVHGRMHCTTYGSNRTHCAQAAMGGNAVKRALGFEPAAEEGPTGKDLSAGHRAREPHLGGADFEDLVKRATEAVTLARSYLNPDGTMSSGVGDCPEPEDVIALARLAEGVCGVNDALRFIGPAGGTAGMRPPGRYELGLRRALGCVEPIPKSDDPLLQPERRSCDTVDLEAAFDELDEAADCGLYGVSTDAERAELRDCALRYARAELEIQFPEPDGVTLYHVLAHLNRDPVHAFALSKESQ